MKTKYLLFCLTFLLFTSNILTSYAQTPAKFNYQAVIRNSTGSALPNEDVDLRFQIYDAQSGGQLIYEETFAGEQTNAFGVLNLQIGGSPTTGNLATLNWGSSVFWVMIRMKPAGTGNYADISDDRTQLVSVPFAMYAANSPQTTYTEGTGIDITNGVITNAAPDQTVTLTSATGINATGTYPNFTIANAAPDQTVAITGVGVTVTGTYPNFTITAVDPTPPGTIVAYGGPIAPLGWQLCDGTFLNKLTYSALFAVIGTSFGEPNNAQFQVPDLRGVFLRGVNGSQSGPWADPETNGRTFMYTGGATGNAIGSVQGDAFQNHTHYIGGFGLASGNGGDTRFNTLSDYGNRQYDRLSGSANGGGSETRPKNVYVNYIIKK